MPTVTASGISQCPRRWPARRPPSHSSDTVSRYSWKSMATYQAPADSDS